jgi:uncharacterized flavoprotein (TIGR03862 family)
MSSGAEPATALVVGGGPGGLMAAEVLATAGLRVTVVEHMPSVGRKLLLAGRSGLNLTHSEPNDELLARYGTQRQHLEQAIAAFGAADLRAWCAGLGEPTFVGSSGRVFPQSFRATPLLRAWLQRLDRLGVAIVTRTRWTGWGRLPDGSIDPRRITVRTVGDDDGSTVRELSADVVVLALGGASWPRVGSDGGWTAVVRDAGVEVHPLRPANCGVRYQWTPAFIGRHAGSPVKNVAVAMAGGPTGHPTAAVRGDLMITDDGLEGGPAYTLSAAVREAIDRTGSATLLIDLHPDLTQAEVATRLERRRPKDSLSTALKRTLGLSPTAVALLREVCGDTVSRDTATLAALVKAVPVVVRATASIDRAISSAGGIAFHEIDESFMLHHLPGVFVAGEMLDWEAPTGGYLLQATFATAVAAAQGALRWSALDADTDDTDSTDSTDDTDSTDSTDSTDTYTEVDAGDTLWRFDRRFLTSNWTCIWGRGCQGIGPIAVPELGYGCCSLGAELDGMDEALTLAANADALSPDLFQFHAEAAADGVFRDEARDATRVVDGACIFLNRVGFAGGAGCALHLAAVRADESPIDWKPSVCWQLPIKVDWVMRDDDVEVATVRGWERRDWGDDGPGMAWCCTEGADAYVGDRPVVDSLADELTEIVGHTVFVELRRRLA